MAAIMRACEVSTAVSRTEQPQALNLTPEQKENIERTWKMVEEESGLLEAGILLFKQYSKTNSLGCAFCVSHYFV